MMPLKKLKLAIIGHGFVGSAVDYGFPDANCDKIIVDPKYKNSVDILSDKNIDASFVCVPTIMSQDASIDVNILIKTVYNLVEHTNGLIVIKSTVIPSIIEELTNKIPRIIYNPEFLTERSANEDFVNPVMQVFGGIKSQTEKLEQIYENYSACKPCPVYHMTPVEASFVKYGMNSFLMSKVLWFNQFFDLVQKHGSNFNVIRNAIATDPRIGHSHTMVPGQDGRKGSGGACFPKDAPALAIYARDQNASFTILEEVIRRNQDYRNAYGDPLPREKEQHIRFDYDI
jgi:UDPglucose 6-dehydrogenase